MAAGLNALVAGATLMVALVLIGPEVLADRTRFIALALRNPAPIVVQDLLKLASAAATVVLLTAFFDRLYASSPTIIRIATAFGGLAVLCLLANAVLSLFAVRQAAIAGQTDFTAADGARLNALIGLLAVCIGVANGIWYLLAHWAALRAGALPGGLGYLGVAVGAFSLVPPLGLIALVLIIVWSAWLCRLLLAPDPLP